MSSDMPVVEELVENNCVGPECPGHDGHTCTSDFAPASCPHYDADEYREDMLDAAHDAVVDAVEHAVNKHMGNAADLLPFCATSDSRAGMYLLEVRGELARQVIERKGSTFDGMMVLMEELGEVAEAFRKGDIPELYAELAQVSAVAQMLMAGLVHGSAKVH